jgi:crossover junction endodeoxyribonuclease RusA
MNFTLPLPPPLNAVYKTGQGRFYKSKKAKDWEQEAYFVIKSQTRRYKSLQELTSPLYVGITLFLKRDRDIDSSMKLLFDLLEDAGIIENDNLIEHLNIKKFMDKKNPRMEIEIETL